MGHVTQKRTPRQAPAATQLRNGFTLIEMIGVLAIIGVLATLMAPNAIRAIDRAAVKAEAATLATLAHSLKSYLAENAALPANASWTTALATYTDLNASSLATNKRQVARVLIYDPASVPAPRALFLSGLRGGLTLPSSSNINTAARFAALWDTPDGEIPPTSSWSAWSTWNAVSGSADYLLIERVNLKPIYLDELRPSSVALNNTTATPTSYEVYNRAGTKLAQSPIAPGASILLSQLAKGDRVLVYANASYANLAYTHICEGQDTSFDLSDWIASAP